MISGNVKVDGEIVGQVVDRPFGHKVYITERDKDTWVKKYNGFGITATLLGKILNSGVDKIEIHYRKQDGSIEIYESTPRNWYSSGVKDELGNFEPQYFLNHQEFESVRER